MTAWLRAHSNGSTCHTPSHSLATRTCTYVQSPHNGDAVAYAAGTRELAQKNRPGRVRGGSRVESQPFSQPSLVAAREQTWPGRGPAVAAAPAADTAVPGEL